MSGQLGKPASFAPKGMLALGLCCLSLYDGLYLWRWLASSPVPPFGDFFGFWSIGRFADRFGAQVYDFEALKAFQHRLDPALPSGGHPYLYPPPFLLLLLPLAWLPLASAWVVWVIGTAAAFVVAVQGWRGRIVPCLALSVLPTTLLAVVSGQNGLLSAALLAGGLRSLGHRPLQAGVLLGLLGYKPQFALLVPVALLAARQWRTLAMAGVTIIALAGASCAVFGWSVWAAWIGGMGAVRAQMAAGLPALVHLMPSVLASAWQVGDQSGIGVALQVATGVAVAAMVAKRCARQIGAAEAALILVGTMLVSPYSFIYDMPIAVAGIALYWRARSQAGEPVSICEAAVAALWMAALLGMTQASLPFVAPVLLGCQFVLIARFVAPPSKFNETRIDATAAATPVGASSP